MRKAITSENLDSWNLPVGGTIEISPIGEYEDQTQMNLDLDELARGSGPVALLAARLLDPEALGSLVRESESLIEESLNTKAFSLVGDLDNDQVPQHTSKIVYRAAMRLLRNMVNQGGLHG